MIDSTMCVPAAQRWRQKKPARTRRSAITRGVEHQNPRLVDALGNRSLLTGGEALIWSAPTTCLDASDTLIATKRSMRRAGLAPLAAAGKTAVIRQGKPATARDYDQYIYQARHLIENFFANSSSFVHRTLRQDRAQLLAAIT